MFRSFPASWFLIAISWLLLAAAQPLHAGDASGMTVDVTTDSQVYPVGTEVRVTVTKCNPTDGAITTTEACPCCNFRFRILDVGLEEVASLTVGCIQPGVTTVWEPGECRSEEFFWRQKDGRFGISGAARDGAQVPDGSYVARYHWFPAELEIIADSEPFHVGGVAEVPASSDLGRLAFLFALVAAAAVLLRTR